MSFLTTSTASRGVQALAGAVAALMLAAGGAAAAAPGHDGNRGGRFGHDHRMSQHRLVRHRGHYRHFHHRHQVHHIGFFHLPVR